MALCAGKVMMMRRAAADAIAPHAIGELDAVEQALIEKCVHCAEDRRPAQATIFMLERAPKIFGREIGALLRHLRQLLGDGAARACVA